MGARLNAYVRVYDEDGAGHDFGPGDKVPGWAAKLITNASAWDEEPEAQEDSDPGSGSEPSKVDYSDLKAADLKAEIARRNAGRDADDLIEPEGTKNADLVAALVADDAAQADDNN